MKKVLNNIIENRYKYSFIAIIVSAIIGYFINSVGIKEWIFTTDKILSLWWSTKFFALLLASYELFLIFANKKLALAGTIILSFSGAVQWNFCNIDSLVLGEIIVVLINKIINAEKVKKSFIILIVGIIACFIAYTYTFQPFAISFGYVFVAFLVFVFIRNKEVLKKDKKKLIILSTTCTLGIISAVIAKVFFGRNNSEEFSTNIYGISYLFSYLYDILLPFNKQEYNYLLGGIISIFPIPVIASLYYMYKNEEHIDFLMPITVVSIFEIVLYMINLSDGIMKVTMFYGIDKMRIMPAIELTNLFLLLYFLSNIKVELCSFKNSMRLTILLICILAFIKYPSAFTDKRYLYLFVCELAIFSITFLNSKDERYERLLVRAMVLISLIGGSLVNLL